MSTWQTPKTDWHPSQPEDLKGEDLNKIGTNLDYLKNERDQQQSSILGLENVSTSITTQLHNLRIVSGSFPENWNVFPGSNVIIHRSAIFVPFNKRLRLKFVSGWLSSTAVNLALTCRTYYIDSPNLVSYDPIITYEESFGGLVNTGNDLYMVDLFYGNKTIRSNNDPNNKNNMVEIRVRVESNDNATLTKGSGWSLGFDVVNI